LTVVFDSAGVAASKPPHVVALSELSGQSLCSAAGRASGLVPESLTVSNVLFTAEPEGRVFAYRAPSGDGLVVGGENRGDKGQVSVFWLEASRPVKPLKTLTLRKDKDVLLTSGRINGRPCLAAVVALSWDGENEVEAVSLMQKKFVKLAAELPVKTSVILTTSMWPETTAVPSK
jgi:hypothetical protein